MRVVRRVLKWTAITLGGLIALFACAVMALSWVATQRMETPYDVHSKAIAIPTDQASIAEGGRLYVTWGCVECHQKDGTGMEEDLPPGVMKTANLTQIANEWLAQDWERAVRHGVTPSGRALLIMPAAEYWHLSDRDLGAIVAYVRSLPKKDPVRGPPKISTLGKVFTALDLMPIPPIPAEVIDHDARPPEPTPGPTVAYGKYLATFCIHCHGSTLAGGEKTFFPMPIANITPHDTGIGKWTRDDFTRLMRTGRRPDGSNVDLEMRNTARTSRFTDMELDALWAFLRSVPPRPYGEQEG